MNDGVLRGVYYTDDPTIIPTTNWHSFWMARALGRTTTNYLANGDMMAYGTPTPLRM
jgi:hypothetical protein